MPRAQTMLAVWVILVLRGLEGIVFFLISVCAHKTIPQTPLLWNQDWKRRRKQPVKDPPTLRSWEKCVRT
jgi:hypothetical protein